MKKKYEQIIESIEKLIEENQLKQGERLPSIRTLAAKYQCNKSTIIRAYKELEMNHKIYAIPNSGYYLVEKNQLEEEEYPVIDLSTVTPDPKLLPYKEFQHCINRAVELYKKSLFANSDVQGLVSLRKVLVNHFRDHQIFTSADKIVITSGAQQALNILSKMPFPNPKKDILVEEPTYSLILRTIKLNGDRLIGIRRNHQGINLEELETIFRKEKIKVFYMIPRFHNPLGTSYSEKEKKRIVQLAEKYDVYIVEDDYLVDIDPSKKRLPAYYYDISEKVIYVKSFSKAFMPGIRIGAVVLHEKLRDEFLKYKKCDDLNTSVLAQGALEIFIQSGMYQNHVKKARYAYQKKMESLKRYIKHFGNSEVEFFIPPSGFFIWVQLPNWLDMGKLMNRLREKKVYVAPGNQFFIGNQSNENSFRICISKLTEDQIQKGIRILFEEINRCKKLFLQ